ncbi:hypothetical protein [Marininema halotolerans]|uniref:Taurine catabolism dioxygenase TauD, TfdA family n=1 Tax=Marininema halotolerans TaxID=1155944 RepID=A0A1I6U3T0_9BACL|nr:hypothetical protein [Marininema halotolerans]SFS96085.1 hypothetical protein SAMN05444972_11347 [Marininema halotolerans]
MTTRLGLSVDIAFTDNDRDYLKECFLQITTNPYTDYDQFQEKIKDLAENDARVQEIMAILRPYKDRDLHEHPFFTLTNCPIDEDLPVFDFKDPVNSKYELKKTFVAEAFLQWFAYIMDQPAIGYVNVNNGDVFQDIYPMESLQETQSQKAIVPLGFHKDLANHFVRPDFVNMLGMRSFHGNQIYTTFVTNKELLAHMSPEEQFILKQALFYTPFDDLSVYGNKKKLGRAKDHAILIDNDDLAYFENRTVGTTEAAQQIVDKINRLLHQLKVSHLMKPGELISVANNHSLHGKDVLSVSDPEQQKKRWTIKTVNVFHLDKHQEHFLEGTKCIVNG